MGPVGQPAMSPTSSNIAQQAILHLTCWGRPTHPVLPVGKDQAWPSYSAHAVHFDEVGFPCHVEGHSSRDDDTLASLVLANLTTVVSFGLISISAIPALAAIGQVVAPGALLALLLSAAGLPRRGVASV